MQAGLTKRALRSEVHTCTSVALVLSNPTASAQRPSMLLRDRARVEDWMPISIHAVGSVWIAEGLTRVLDDMGDAG